MAISSELLEILVCPKCQLGLQYDPKQEGLFCGACSCIYPIRDGVAVMLEEEAFEVGKGGEVMPKTAKASVAYFKIQEGPNQGEIVKLPSGACKAIGRSIDDVNKTQVFSMEPTVPLDDFTKNLVLNYLGKKTGKKIGPIGADGGFGSFKRLPDMVLNDPAISRLHAMIFHDDSGAGILDLVSRNGTYVNGQEIESRPLQEGDMVEIGSTKIIFSLNSPR
ncbi:MAG: FHA domain-containing protein [Deltaproteobacteria bacterium]|nr:FHA domain-containing protein [Deltaproteobacteria bacterium]